MTLQNNFQYVPANAGLDPTNPGKAVVLIDQNGYLIGTTSNPVAVNLAGGNISLSGASITVPLAANQQVFGSVTLSGNPNVMIQSTINASGLPWATISLAPTATTIGITSSQIAASNVSRKGMIIQNISSGSQIAWLGLGTPAISGLGITLYAGGGSFQMDQMAFTTQAINAISSAANTLITVQEFN